MLISGRKHERFAEYEHLRRDEGLDFMKFSVYLLI